MKLSSKDIWSFIRLIWNLTALERVILPVSIKAPPFISRVAASGTCSTLKPICCKTTDSVASAVVLPAHGPPVKQILVIGCLLSLRAFLASRAEPSSLLLDVRLRLSSCYPWALFLDDVRFMTRSTLSISSLMTLSLLSPSVFLPALNEWDEEASLVPLSLLLVTSTWAFSFRILRFSFFRSSWSLSFFSCLSILACILSLSFSSFWARWSLLLIYLRY